ncbi:MAG: hypothetical protein HN341_00045, partial [Verrucomicrobia bacterium]|nr:hypothetical protein [Verrucomicrobiota bacterium]
MTVNSNNQHNWLTTPWAQDDADHRRRNPIFRRTFSVTGTVESAEITICGLGHYELYLNGTRVGDRQLEPAFSNYDKRVYFSSYDISAYLKEGENVLALYLGRGRHNMDTVSVWGFEKAPWRAPCRYVEISGFTNGFGSDQVTALVMHQDVKARGSFNCSNALINQIHKVSTRALLNNAHHVITDTPTYEKNGWTGDAQLTATMGLYNFEIERFYRKFVADLRDSQLPSGELAPIVPTSG